MRTTSTREGSEIALPRKISTLLDSTNKWLHHKKKELHTVYIAPPPRLFSVIAHLFHIYKEAFNRIYDHVCAIRLLQCEYGYIDFVFVGAAASKKQKNEYQLLNRFPSIMYDILNRHSKSKRNVPGMEYYVRSLTLINRPAFLDRSGWSDIRRGITCAETKLKTGESKRLVPFSTNTSRARNNILHHIVFKGIRIESNLNDDISSHFIGVSKSPTIVTSDLTLLVTLLYCKL